MLSFRRGYGSGRRIVSDAAGVWRGSRDNRGAAVKWGGRGTTGKNYLRPVLQ